jgi:hypothetical protein
MSDSFDLQSILDQFIRTAVSDFWSLAKQMFFIYWPYMIGFLVIVIAGVTLQIFMLKSGGHSKLSAGFNSLVGSLTYSVFFLIYFGICYWIFGTQVVDDIWFAVFGAMSFPSTGFFLKSIGFWYY